MQLLISILYDDANDSIIAFKLLLFITTGSFVSITVILISVVTFLESSNAVAMSRDSSSAIYIMSSSPFLFLLDNTNAVPSSPLQLNPLPPLPRLSAVRTITRTLLLVSSVHAAAAVAVSAIKTSFRLTNKEKINWKRRQRNTFDWTTVPFQTLSRKST